MVSLKRDEISHLVHQDNEDQSSWCNSLVTLRVISKLNVRQIRRVRGCFAKFSQSRSRRTFRFSNKKMCDHKRIHVHFAIDNTFTKRRTTRHQFTPNCAIILLRIFGVTKHSLYARLQSWCPCRPTLIASWSTVPFVNSLNHLWLFKIFKINSCD